MGLRKPSICVEFSSHRRMEKGGGRRDDGDSDVTE